MWNPPFSALLISVQVLGGVEMASCIGLQESGLV